MFYYICSQIEQELVLHFTHLPDIFMHALEKEVCLWQPVRPISVLLINPIRRTLQPITNYACHVTLFIYVY